MKTIAVILAVGLLAQAAGSQDQFERQVRRQLEEVGSALKARGYELTHQVFTGNLDEDENAEVLFRLQQGRNYAIVGVCDHDCLDVDIRLADPTGSEVARDIEDDAVPVVEIRAGRAGQYTVTVEMVSCKDEPCAFGIGVFATGLDDFDRQVHTQLSEATKQLGRDGFRLTHQIFTGTLRQGQTEDTEFELDAGSAYLILGVCDTDCRDLDLELLDSAGRRVDADDGDDDVPVVAASPARRERYTVRATMANCGDNPCRYGLGAVRR